MKKTILLGISLFALLCLGCSSQSRTGGPYLGQYIATVDTFAYFWNQISDDSAHIYKIDAYDLLDTCRITGHVCGALAASIEVDTMPVRGGWLFYAVLPPDLIDCFSRRYFFIKLGDGRYMLFDTKLFPSEMNLLE